MTEQEYDVETLCCLPGELLVVSSKGNSREVPEWLNQIPAETKRYALEHYNDLLTKKVRERGNVKNALNC